MGVFEELRKGEISSRGFRFRSCAQKRVFWKRGVSKRSTFSSVSRLEISSIATLPALFRALRKSGK